MYLLFFLNLHIRHEAKVCKRTNTHENKKIVRNNHSNRQFHLNKLKTESCSHKFTTKRKQIGKCCFRIFLGKPIHMELTIRLIKKEISRIEFGTKEALNE